MLEHLSLWLSAPTTVWPPGRRVGQASRRSLYRRVLAADSREPLGHVAETPGRWWPWPAAKRIAGYELPDGSLLFAARRIGWFLPITIVADADGRVVALVNDQNIASPSRRLLARRRGAGWRAGTFIDPAGAELVHWEAAGGGTVVHFADVVRNE